MHVSRFGLVASSQKNFVRKTTSWSIEHSWAVPHEICGRASYATFEMVANAAASHVCFRVVFVALQHHAIGRARAQIACVLFMATFSCRRRNITFVLCVGGGEGVRFLLLQRKHIDTRVCLNICSHSSHPGGALCSALLRAHANDGRMGGGVGRPATSSPQRAVLILSWGLVMGTSDFKQTHAFGHNHVVMFRSWAQQLRVSYR